MGFFSRMFRFFASIPFVRDLVAMQTGSFIYLVATFFSSIAFARLLGIENFGRYAVILSFVGTVSVFTNIGQGSALLVFFAEESGRKNREGMATVLRNFLQISGLNAFVLCLLAIASPWITMKLYADPVLGHFASFLFLFQAIDSVTSMTIVLLQALRKIRAKIMLEQAENLSYLSLAVLLLFLGHGIAGIVLAQLSVGIVFAFLSLFIVRMLWKQGLIPSLSEIWSVPLRRTWQYFSQGVFISIDKNVGNLFPQGLFFALSLVAPASLIGAFRIAHQLAAIPRSVLIAPVGDLSLTVLARQRDQGTDVLRRNAARIIKHSFALQSAVSLAAAFVFPPLVAWVYGAQYLVAIVPMLWMLLFSLPVSLCITNAAFLRLFRKIPYSTMQAAVSWALMLGIIFGLSNTLSPYTAFLIAYAIGPVLPLTITTYIFIRLLPKR